MDIPKTDDLYQAFLSYKSVVSSTLNNINFYRSFLKSSIDKYHNQEYQPQQIYSSVFHAYNISPQFGDGFSRMYLEVDHFNTSELHASSETFISSFANLSLLKIYNAMKVFLFQAIQIKYFPDLEKTTGSRQATNKLSRDIEAVLKERNLSADARNNRYVLTFMKEMSREITWFFDQKLRIDLNTTYSEFFDLVSILRNLIGHHGTVVSNDSKNEILSKAKDVFTRHFDLLKEADGYYHLNPKVNQFSNFISFYNEFTMNSVKFIFGYNDLHIFDMY